MLMEFVLLIKETIGHSSPRAIFENGISFLLLGGFFFFSV